MARLKDRDLIHVLHIDDEEDFLDLAKAFLERMSNKKIVVDSLCLSDINQVIMRLHSQNYDIVLCDYFMNTANGIQILTQIRTNNFQIPFVMLTGKGREEVAMESLNLGANKYIVKEGDSEELFNKIYATIGSVVSQNRSERKIRDLSEKDYQKYLLETISDAVIVTNLHFDITGWNKASEQIYGYLEDQVLKKSYLEIIPTDLILKEEDTIEKSEDFMNTFLETGYWSGNLVQQHRDGSKIHIDSSMAITKDSEGKPHSIIIINRDVTNTKRVQTLLELEKDLSIQFGSTNDLNVIYNDFLDFITRIEGIDSACIYTADQEAKLIRLIFSRGINQDFVDAISTIPFSSIQGQKILKGKPIYSDHEKLALKWDDIRNKETLKAMAILPIRYRSEIIGFISLASHSLDEIPLYSRTTLESIASQIGGVISRIRAEERHTSVLIRQNQELRRYAQILNHDLNNSLTIIDGYIRLLTENYEKNYLPIIEKQLKYIRNISKHSLELAEVGLIIEKRENIDLNPIIIEAAKTVIPKEIQFVNEPINFRIACDPRKVLQIFKNLLENAVIHGNPHKIEVKNELENPISHTILITNDGERLPLPIQEKINRLFETTSHSSQSTGLDIVKKLIEAHDWQLSFRAEPCTTFVICIPK